MICFTLLPMTTHGAAAVIAEILQNRPKLWLKAYNVAILLKCNRFRKRVSWSLQIHTYLGNETIEGTKYKNEMEKKKGI